MTQEMVPDWGYHQQNITAGWMKLDSFLLSLLLKTIKNMSQKTKKIIWKQYNM